VVIELTDKGYVTHGTKFDAIRSDRLALIRELLPGEPPGITPAEMLDNWPEGQTKPSAKTIKRDLAAESAFLTTGAGKKGDPIRYYLPQNSIPDNPLYIGVSSISPGIEQAAERRVRILSGLPVDGNQGLFEGAA
jgi:hypothetical protein